MRTGRAEFLALLLLSAPAPAAGSGRPTRSLDEVLKLVVAIGGDDELDQGSAAFLGLSRDAPLRVVWVDRPGKKPGYRRGFAVAYNSPKGSIEPAAIILFLTDAIERAGRRTTVVGRAFLANLDGTLARAVLTERWQEAGLSGSNDAPILLRSQAGEKDFRAEMRFWRRDFDPAGWKRPRKYP